jgi:hypothetical protein
MKTKTILSLLVLALSSIAFSQTADDRPAVYWDNGNVTLIEDLGEVWIEKNNGTTIKNTKIWEILPAKGKIVYEKNRSLHDLPIADVYRVRAGANSLHIMYFDTAYQPVIVYSGEYVYNGEVKSDFKVSYKRDLTKPEINTQRLAEQKEAPVPLLNLLARDTVVRANGEVLPVRIIQLSATAVSYKRGDLADGPLYNVNIEADTEIIRSANSIKLIFK